MSKLKKRRRNGKVITVGTKTTRVLSGEAKKLIASGESAQIYDSYGKVKKKYINVIHKKYY
jgi:hypothetical protein